MKNDEILNQLFDTNSVEKQVQVIPGKITAVFSNLKVKDQLQIEKEMSSTDGNTIYTLHTYTLKILSATLKKWNDEIVENRQQAMQILDNLPSRLIDKLINEQQGLENQISDALGLDSIKENFSPGVELQQGSEQSPEE